MTQLALDQQLDQKMRNTMKSIVNRAATAGVIIMMGIVGSAWSGDSSAQGPNFNVGGNIFAIEGEYLFVIDFLEPVFGVTEGDTFDNCYYFNADGVADEVSSGEWIDPLFPGPAGAWVQHTNGPILRYTALADDGAGLALAQNGTVKPGRGKRARELEGYSTVTITGLGVVAEIVSRGYAVEECPYDLP